MASAVAETIINKPADEVWAKVSNFADVTWIPNTESCELDGDVRSVRMRGRDGVVQQRLTSRVDSTRVLTYCMAGELEVAPGFVLHEDDLKATITVIPQGESQSRVTYGVETLDSMVEAVHAEYQGALDAVKAELEG
jgi:carbon monoxide dehydrogenase subunit G